MLTARLGLGLAFLWLHLLVLAVLPAQAAERGTNRLTILYSVDERGEIAPCG